MNLISIGELIKQSWQLYTKNFKTFLQIIMWVLLLQVLSAVLVILNLPLISVSIVSFVTAIVGIWTSIVLILTVNDLINQRTPNLKEYYKLGWTKFLSYLWVSILAGIITAIGFILLIVPGIIFMVWFAFATYIVVLEDQKGKETLSKSKEMTKDRWWATFGRLILPGLFYGVIMMVIIFALTYIGGLFTGNVALAMRQPTFWWSQLVSAIIPNLFIPLFVSAVTLLYLSMKKTKAGSMAATPKEQKPEMPQV